ncbi:MAG: hypothetical protein J7513_15405 [Solirubrobacteraceae bacterium]|nr:hypothetical protein [Solirubrobacteraceae bacterium]
MLDATTALPTTALPNASGEVGEPDCLRSAITARRSRRSRTRHALTTWFALLAFLVALGAAADRSEARLSTGTVFGPVAHNPADALDDTIIDDQFYDRATHCVKQPTKGALALVKWLPTISPRGINWGINRCEMWGKKSASLHAEGRAIDWHLDVHNSADKAEAERVIRVLLAPDANGNPHALARRLGVQGLIWNCQAWWGGQSLVRYSVCNGKNGRLNAKVDDTTAHRNHIHLELNKAGAKLQTSWWTRRAATTKTKARPTPTPAPAVIDPVDADDSQVADDDGINPDGGATVR